MNSSILEADCAWHLLRPRIPLRARASGTNGAVSARDLKRLFAVRALEIAHEYRCIKVVHSVCGYRGATRVGLRLRIAEGNERARGRVSYSDACRVTHAETASGRNGFTVP